MKAYVDVGRKKVHAVFFPENGQTMKLESLTELQDNGVSNIYVDALFPNALRDLYEVAENGVRVFHLRRLSVISLLRERHGLEKNDSNDARLLASIPIDEFREISEPQIRMRMLINEYYAIADTLKQVRQRQRIILGNRLEEPRKFLERQHHAVEKETMEAAEKSLPEYLLVRERLGLNGVSLATLLTYVNFEHGFAQIIRQVGWTDHHRRTGRFSGKPMRALNGLATNSVRHGNERYRELYQYYLGILESKRKALLRVQTWILEDIHHVVTGGSLREATKPK